jgi:hypothetical protein
MTVETPTILDLIINFYGYYVPFILMAIWAPMAILDLAKRNIDAKTGTIWSIIIVGLPLIGAGAYHIFGKSELPQWFRNIFVYGGMILLILIMILSSILKY